MSSLKSKSKMVWAGRVISILVVLPFIASVIGKLMGGAEVSAGMAHVGIPESLLLPLAVIEGLCVVIYLIPQTCVLGAILFTGYIGGTIVTHLRLSENVIMQISLGVLVWLGLYLRDGRIRELIPLRKS